VVQKVQKKRVARKELKQPSVLSQFFERAYAWIEPHLTKIVVGVAALTALVIGWAIFSHFADKRTEAATEIFGRATAIAQADLLPADGTPPPPTQDQTVPQFKTAAERDQAVLDKLSEIDDKYRHTPVEARAVLLEAAAYYHLGQLDQAADRYQTYIKGADSDDPALGMAHLGLGYTLEAQKRYQDAMDEFDRSAPSDNPSAFGRDRALYEHARMQEALGQPQAALATYQQVVAIPGTSLKQAAEDRVAVLEASSPSPSPSPAAASQSAQH
jgi:tetratricopeptide (TPR) repeat protein